MFVIVENLNDLGEGCSIIFLDARSDCGDLCMSNRKMYGIKISHSSNFNPISITLWYENNIIIFFLSIVMDSDKWGTMNVKIPTFNDSVLSNTANDIAGFSSAKYIIFGWLWSNFRFFVHGHGWIFSSLIVFKALKVPWNHFRVSFGSPTPRQKTLGPTMK